MSKQTMNASQRALLELLGRSLFQAEHELPNDIDWDELSREMTYQAVLPLAVDALKREEQSCVPQELKKQWGYAISRSYITNERILLEQKRVLDLFISNGIKCAVLKGFSAAINYPKPELRMMGDIDLLVDPAQQNDALDLLLKDGYEKISEGTTHHYPVEKNGIEVEIHKTINGLDLVQNEEFKRALESLFSNALEHSGYENGIPVLPDECQAIALLFHKIKHIHTVGFGLRQLCDWAAFVNRKMTPQLWDQLEAQLELWGMLPFTKVVTRMCVEYLSLPQVSAPWAMDCDLELVDCFLEQILNDGNFGRKEKDEKVRYAVKRGESNIHAFIRFVISAMKHNWPLCDKFPVLLPVAPLVAYYNYRKRYAGKRNKVFRPITMYQDGKRRTALKQALGLFEI